MKTVFTADPNIYYLRYYVIPVQKISNFSERYDPHSAFWKAFRRRVSRLPAATSRDRVPITNSVCAPDPAILTEFAWRPAEPDLQLFITNRIKTGAAGYPTYSNLQKEMLEHAKNMYSIVDQLPVAIFREDLSRLFLILCTLQSSLSQLRGLGGLNYKLREESYHDI